MSMENLFTSIRIMPALINFMNTEDFFQNELNREIAEELLKETEISVDCAEDGIEAVNIINDAPENKYDLVLVDIQMPRMVIKIVLR